MGSGLLRSHSVQGHPHPWAPLQVAWGLTPSLSYQGLSCPSPRPSPLSVYKLLGAGDPSCLLSPRATKGLLAGHVACASASPSISPGDKRSCGQAAPARELTGGGSAVPAGSACQGAHWRPISRSCGVCVPGQRTHPWVPSSSGTGFPALGRGHSWVCRGGWGGRVSGRSGRSEQRRAVGKSEGVERGGKPLPAGPSAPGTVPAQDPGAREAPSSWTLTSGDGAQPWTWQCPAYDRGPQSPLLDGADDDRPTIVSRMT